MTVSGRTAVIGLVLASIATTLLLSLARGAAERGGPRPVVSGSASGGPSESGSPSLTPFSPHVVATPLESGPSEVVPRAQSGDALAGVIYSARLLTPCVVLVDFDGAFWVAPPGFTLYEPTQPATIRLFRDGHVELRTAGGQDVTLRPLDGPATIPPCP